MLVGGLLTLIPVSFLQVIGVALSVLAAAILLPAVYIVLVVDYWRSAYGRTGYLTQTIPAPGSRIYAARLLFGAVVSVVAGLLTVVLGLISAILVARQSGPTPTEGTRMLFDGLREALTAAGVGWTSAAVVFGALMIVTYLVQYYFAASIGSEGRLGALGPVGPVLVWFALYLAVQLVTAISLLAIPFGIGTANGSLAIVPMNLWDAMVGSAHQPEAQGMPLGVVVSLLLVGVLLVWRTAHSWNHKVSLR